MSQEGKTEPLHVQVALALGWRWTLHKDDKLSKHPGQRFLLAPDGGDPFGYFKPAEGTEPLAPGYADDVPRYDTDWSATGPLIERFNITLIREYWADPKGSGEIMVTPKWLAIYGFIETGAEIVYDFDADADSPLIAVCNLLLSLHAAGKLTSCEPASAPTDPR
jgi:hypothetical protein